MSDANNEIIMEGLADEFYEDPSDCIDWIVLWESKQGEKVDVVKLRESILALSEEEQVEYYVNKSMEVMAQ